MTYIHDPFAYLRLQVIKKLIPQNKYSTICDLGCGEGLFTEFIEKQTNNSQVIGIDINSKKIERAIINSPSTVYIRGDSTKIPLKSSSCDLVFCFELIEHINNTKSLLQEVRRILKPEGIFILSTPNIHSFTAFTGKIAYFMMNKKYTAFDETHINLFWPERLLDNLRVSNFKKVDIYGIFPYPTGFTYPPFLRKLIKSPYLLKFLSKTFKNKFLVELSFITLVICKGGE